MQDFLQHQHFLRHQQCGTPSIGAFIEPSPVKCGGVEGVLGSMPPRSGRGYPGMPGCRVGHSTACRSQSCGPPRAGAHRPLHRYRERHRHPSRSRRPTCRCRLAIPSHSVERRRRRVRDAQTNARRDPHRYPFCVLLHVTGRPALDVDTPSSRDTTLAIKDLESTSVCRGSRISFTSTHSVFFARRPAFPLARSKWPRHHWRQTLPCYPPPTRGGNPGR